jgi:hypothetical protein
MIFYEIFKDISTVLSKPKNQSLLITGILPLPVCVYVYEYVYACKQIFIYQLLNNKVHRPLETTFMTLF